MPEYLDPAIAGEGHSCNDFVPGSWTHAPAGVEEYQPEMEEPHIPDYAALKKNKHYKQYFRPYRYQPFPAFLYHPTLGSRVVKSKEEVIALGSEWSKVVPIWFHPTFGKKIVRSDEDVQELGAGWAPAIWNDTDKRWKEGRDMAGKSLPVKSETQRLTEVVAAGLSEKKTDLDPSIIAAIVSSVMAALKPEAPKPEPEVVVEPMTADENNERKALLKLAEDEGIKIDHRWGNARLREALGL